MSDKPVYRVGAAGLDPRDGRLIEIVFRHSQHNRHAFQLCPRIEAGSVDILIANTRDPAGIAALVALRASAPNLPVVVAVPSGSSSTARHLLPIDRLTLQLLPVLNRVVELELLPAAVPPRAPGASASGSQAHSSGHQAEARAQLSGGPALEARTEPPNPVPPSPSPSPVRPVPVAAVPLPAVAIEPSQARALVVDDSPTVRKQLGLAFERLGLECLSVASAAEAIARLAQERFDLVLVDVVMPDMDGYRLTRQIRRDRRLKGLPVIILTSRSSPFDLARGALAGCDTYLTKPVPFRALEAAVRRLLRRSGAADLAVSAAVADAGAPASGASTTQPTLAPPRRRLARLFGR